ncbi:MAG: SHOCT domain-containing protein [Robiginitomaculum sp.]|nr:SHOCT domain-containing protein [Robiginitomaculum sp.]MDQ7077158.1 SHOCT domain-containing protein [Robiginitomaculum sp.]
MGSWGVMPWYGMILGPIFFILVLFVIVRLLVGINNPDGSNRNRAGQSASALDILEARFAKGEIDQKEFEERKRVLGK